MLVNALKYLLCKFDPVAADRALPNGVIPNVTKSTSAVSKSYLETTNDTSLNKTKDKLSRQKTDKKDKKKDYKKKKSKRDADEISLDSDEDINEFLLNNSSSKNIKKEKTAPPTLAKQTAIAAPPKLGKQTAINRPTI